MTNISRLKGVPETLLIPLMGRALETQKDNAILKDPKSLEIFKSLNYDFKKFYDEGSKRSMQRTTIRTAIIDRIVQDFLQSYPRAIIVEIGCGLNARFERLDNGILRWYDLDVPPVYEVWKDFFQETERRTFLPYSAFDDTWMSSLKKENAGPCLFISEASVIYFPEEKVRKLFVNLYENFPGSQYLFDSATPAFLNSLKKNNDALQYCNAHIKWSIEDAGILRKWIPGVEVLETIHLETSDHDFSFLYPPDFKKEAEGYHLNLVRF